MTPAGARVGPPRWRLFAVTTALLLPALTVFSAPETVRITVPAAIGFAVTNVSANTVGTPTLSTVSFSSLTVTAGRVLRISVKADSNFVPPSGAAIPASKVSWTTSSASNGTGSSGVLSTSAYAQVFQSAATRTSGSVRVTWTLAAPGTPLRAGNHRLTVRWKLESIVP